MQTYGRPPTDPLFLGRSRAEWEQEVLEEMLVKRDRLRHDIDEANKTDSGVSTALRSQLIEQLNSIADIFGEERFVLDPLVDAWERELQEGKIPDFNRR